MEQNGLSHRARIEAALAGSKPDRVPFALWRHFPVDDQNPDRLAAATAAFQRYFDFDLIKVTPASSFCIRDWGVRDEWRGNPEGTRDYTNKVVNHAEDWEKLPVLDPTKGALGGQLSCLQKLVAEFGPELPILQTVFSPLSQAKHLVGPGEISLYLHRYPDALEAGLKQITDTTIRFVEEAKKTGIAGIFYAVQHAQFSLLSLDEFSRFVRAFDLQILEATHDLWLNLLHIHGEDLMFDQVLDYPVQVMNWHDRQTPPTLVEAQAKFNGVVCGGLRQWDTMVLGTPDQVHLEAEDAIAQTGGERFILGTGCVLPITAPYGNIVAARESSLKPIPA